jgi:hypothetical protein
VQGIWRRWWCLKLAGWWLLVIVTSLTRWLMVLGVVDQLTITSMRLFAATALASWRRPCPSTQRP